MASGEIEISQLELADEILADMVTPVETTNKTMAITLKQLKKWLGSSLPTGFILPAVGKINDERFTLLDGKTLSRTGTYKDFCDKVIEQVQAGNWFSCSEEEYNADVSAYGQCGKFVVSNDYVRIPKITRFIGATITLSEIGKSYAESLPNIKGETIVPILKNQEETSGAFSTTLGNNADLTVKSDGTYNRKNVSFNASRSSSTYQDGAKVQPDHTKYPYYMVVSTEGQTASVDVDINKVYEDLELKANTSFSNLTAEGKSLASGLGMPSDEYIDLTLGASNSTYTAPANGWFFVAKNSSAGQQFLGVVVNNSTYGGWATSVSNGNTLSQLLPVSKDDVVKISYSAGGAVVYFRFIYAEGEQ